jgi:hypothetical protein
MSNLILQICYRRQRPNGSSQRKTACLDDAVTDTVQIADARMLAPSAIARRRLKSLFFIENEAARRRAFRSFQRTDRLSAQRGIA